MTTRLTLLRSNVLTLALALICIVLLLAVWRGGQRSAIAPVADRRSFIVANEPSDPASPAPDDELLARPIPISVFHSPDTLHHALEEVAKAAQCNIRIDWDAIERAAIPRGAIVNVNWIAMATPASTVTLDQALQSIADDLEARFSRIGYVAVNGAIVVSTAEKFPVRTVRVVYNIRDLIDAEVRPTTQSSRPSRQEVVDQWVGLIREMVARDSWRDMGGTIGSIQELMGLLAIDQTPANHKEIAALLEMFRKSAHEQGSTAPMLPPVKAEDRQIHLTPDAARPPELSQTIDRLPLTDRMTHEQAINALETAAKVRIHVDWPSLLAAGVDDSWGVQNPSSFVNVSVGEAIRRILIPDDEIGLLSFQVRGGAIGVSLRRTTETYDVHDLLDEFDEGPRNVQANERDRPALVEAIIHSVDPNSWGDQRGALGFIQHIPGDYLVVTQSRSAQLKVAEILRKLRKAKDDRQAERKQ